MQFDIYDKYDKALILISNILRTLPDTPENKVVRELIYSWSDKLDD